MGSFTAGSDALHHQLVPFIRSWPRGKWCGGAAKQHREAPQGLSFLPAGKAAAGEGGAAPEAAVFSPKGCTTVLSAGLLLDPPCAAALRLKGGGSGQERCFSAQKLLICKYFLISFSFLS